MFKQLLDMINQEAISQIWKSFPEAQANEGQLKQAQQQKSRYDTSRMKASQADSTGMGLQTTSGKPLEGAKQPPMGNTKENQWQWSQNLVEMMSLPYKI